MIATAGISGSVTLTGMLSGSLKWAALRAASLFVLPSHSEGFSVAVLEALACGVPVVITRQCHFPEVVPAGCGWECDVTAADISAALSQALGTSAEDLAGMGRRGRELAAGRYSWASVGRATADMLDSVLGEARHAAG
jgi:glycosyltransferase involved in cell wall biosynthesis